MGTSQSGKKAGSIHSYRIGKDDFIVLVRTILQEVKERDDKVSHTISTDIKDGQISSDDIEDFFNHYLPKRLTNLTVSIYVKGEDWTKNKSIYLFFTRFDSMLSITSPTISWALGHFNRINGLLTQYRTSYYFLYIYRVHLMLLACIILLSIISPFTALYHNWYLFIASLLFTFLLLALMLVPLVLPRNQIFIQPPKRFISGARIYAGFIAVVAVITAIFAITGPIHK